MKIPVSETKVYLFSKFTALLLQSFLRSGRSAIEKPGLINRQNLRATVLPAQSIEKTQNSYGDQI
jgi:hypothetical protein